MTDADDLAAMLVRLGAFRRFRASAGHGFEQAGGGQRPRVRNHVVHMGGDGTAFLFHDGEMSELCDLLEGAHRALRRPRPVRARAHRSDASDAGREAMH